MTLEMFLAENFKYITPLNIITELQAINETYDNYNHKISLYIRSIDVLINEIDDLYKHLYTQCMSRTNGLDLFTRYGYVLVNVLREILRTKTEWSIYYIKFKSFLNKHKNSTIQFINMQKI